jgi:predicted MFS family arabinose efflux permease
MLINGRPNVAPSLGPVLGGVLAELAGWKRIVWMLAIMSGVCLVILLVIFPETSHSIVGNGSVSAHGINQSLLAYLKTRKME